MVYQLVIQGGPKKKWSPVSTNRILTGNLGGPKKKFLQKSSTNSYQRVTKKISIRDLSFIIVTFNFAMILGNFMNYCDNHAMSSFQFESERLYIYILGFYLIFLNFEFALFLIEQNTVTQVPLLFYFLFLKIIVPSFQFYFSSLVPGSWSIFVFLIRINCNIF